MSPRKVILCSLMLFVVQTSITANPVEIKATITAEEPTTKDLVIGAVV